MKYNNEQILNLTNRNLNIAKKSLEKLPVFCGTEPNIAGLHGWVYEQTIQFCLRKELAALGLKPECEEQVAIAGKAKADFRLDRILIEVKRSGLFGQDDIKKYGKYCKLAENKGYRYLFVTACEGDAYRQGIIDALGRRNCFILSMPKDWNRFVKTVIKGLKKSVY